MLCDGITEHALLHAPSVTGCRSETAFPMRHASTPYAPDNAKADKAEAAYRRGDQFDKRRKLMEASQVFADLKPLAKVVQLKH